MIGKKAKFLQALLLNDTIDKASESAGISRSTGYLYLKDDEFMAEYRVLRRQQMTQVTARLQGISGVAVEKLEERLLDPETSANVINMIARTVLEFAYRGIELEDLEERIEKLEGQTEVR